MVKRKLNYEDVLGYLGAFGYLFILLSKNEFRIDKWYTVLFIALFLFIIITNISAVNEVQVTEEGLKLIYIHKKRKTLLFSDINELVYKHHSKHTYYLIVKYNTNKEVEKYLELRGREWRNLKGFISLLDENANIQTKVKSKKIADVFGIDVTDDLEEKFWEVKSGTRESFKNVIKYAKKDSSARNAVMAIIFSIVLLITFSSKTASLFFILSIVATILSILYLIVNLIAKMYLFTNKEISRIFHTVCMLIVPLIFIIDILRMI